MLTTGLSLKTARTGEAPVGFGPAEGTPPHEAHEPMAMTAPALLATSWMISSAVRPPIMQ